MRCAANGGFAQLGTTLNHSWRGALHCRSSLPEKSSILMVEISETGSPAPTTPLLTQTTSAKVEERKSNPGTKRLFLTLSVLFSFLSGIPFFLKSTEIYRSPLPFGSISSLSSSLNDSLTFPLHLHTVFVTRSSDTLSPPRSLSDTILTHIRKESSELSVNVSVTIDSGGNGGVDGDWKYGALDGIGLSYDDDEAMDEILYSVIDGGESRVYTIVVILNEEEVRVVVGKHRHAWIVGRMSESEILDMISEIFVKLFIKGGREVATEGEGEFMPVGLDGSILLSFSLLNSDPNDWIYDWEMEKFDKLTLAPTIEALGPIANIRIESQVLYHTPKSSMSVWDDNLGSFIFSTSDLPFFVNSNEWHLDTSIEAAGRTKVLQFVVYVPSADECPLLLRLPSGDISKTNGFISPMWGGVVVWNPPNCSMNTQMTRHKRNVIPFKEMEKILQIFIGQLRLLFGFKSSYFHEFGDCKFSFVPSGRGFTEWELDVLFRHHASSNLLSCASTLESLSKLVQSLPRMIVTDEIGKQVKFSLEAAELAKNNASRGLYDASAVSFIKARALAENAFFHPSIKSISYSSIQHYFAIYMPYFAPVALHVLLAALKEIKRYRTERAKYQLFVASQTTTS